MAAPIDQLKKASLYLDSNHREACLAGTELGVSIGIGMAFILLSTRAQRRQRALFAINCFSVACVIATEVIRLRMTTLKLTERVVGGHSIELGRLNVICYFFVIWSPLVADSTLLFKLASFYPNWSGWKRHVVLGIYSLLLLARLATACVMIRLGVRDYVGVIARGTPFYAVHNDMEARVVLICAPLQLATCSFAAVVLFHRAYAYSASVARQPTNVARRRIQRQLRLVIETTTMTFLPPVMCQIIILVAMTCHSTSHAAKRAVGWAMDLNMVFSLFFSILATSWSTIRKPSTPSNNTSCDGAPHLRQGAAMHLPMNKLPEEQQHPNGRPSFSGHPHPMVTSDSLLADFLERAGLFHDGASEGSMEVMATVPSRHEEDEDEAEQRPKGRWLRAS